MATATLVEKEQLVKRMVVDKINLELSLEEAIALYALVSRVFVQNAGNYTYQIFRTLDDIRSIGRFSNNAYSVFDQAIKATENSDFVIHNYLKDRRNDKSSELYQPS